MIAKDILSTKFLKIDIEDTISQMIGKMRTAKTHHALVFEGNNYLGLVGKKFLITSRIDPHTMKVKNIIKKRSKAKTPFYVPILKTDTKIKEIARLMNTADVHVLPVMQKGKITAVVTIEALAKAIAPEYKDVAVSEIAAMKLETARDTDEIGKIIEKMKERNVEHIPITDNLGKIAGIVSAGNIIEEFHLWNAFTSIKIPSAASHQQGKRKGFGVRDKIHILRVPIAQIMTKEVCCTKPTTKIPEAVEAMQNVTSIVLTENNEPIGIMTLKDLIKDYAK